MTNDLGIKCGFLSLQYIFNPNIDIIFIELLLVIYQAQILFAKPNLLTNQTITALWIVVLNK